MARKGHIMEQEKAGFNMIITEVTSDIFEVLEVSQFMNHFYESILTKPILIRRQKMRTVCRKRKRTKQSSVPPFQE